MYTENYCVTYVSPVNTAYVPQYPPITSNEEDNSSFQGVLADSICKATPPSPDAPPPYQAYSESPAAAVYETVCVNVNNTCPIDSVPPVIKTQEPAGPSYVSKYYPITEAEVIPKIIEVRHIINNENLAAKTEIERYNFIENRFVDAFGKDFMIARDLFLPSSMYYMIGVEFNDTLSRHIENPEQVNRQRLHGNASTEAIQDKIRDSFPADLTNGDLFRMVGQMRNEGVLDASSVRSVGEEGSRRLMDTLSVLKNYARYSVMPKDNLHKPLSLADRDSRWTNLLNKPVNLNYLLGTFNVWKIYDRVDIGEDTANFLVNHMGGILQENGLFVTYLPIDIDWNSLMDMMFAEFEEYDALVRDRLNEIDAMFNPAAGETVIEGETTGAEENLKIEESAGAEENLDNSDANDQYTYEVVESNPEAA
jgi:hypothetical protein